MERVELRRVKEENAALKARVNRLTREIARIAERGETDSDED